MNMFSFSSSLPSLNKVVPEQFGSFLAKDKKHQTTKMIYQLAQTAQLLSKQLLELHTIFSNETENEVLKNCPDLNETPVSSGYSSRCGSYESVQFSKSCIYKNSEQFNSSNESSINETSTSISSISSNSDDSFVQTFEKSTMESNLFKIPKVSGVKHRPADNRYNTPKRNHLCQEPSIPRIKEFRKKVKRLPGKESYKLRCFYNDVTEN